MHEPPESGTLDFCIAFAPISLQARSSRKRVATAEFQKNLPSTEFLLSGDVSLEIEWLIHEETRYESDAAPDVDNILKPLMDALCGPTGILIDDNQVQSIMCSWIDWTRTDELLSVRIRFTPGDFVRKDGLMFVAMTNSLCMPINRNLPAEALRELLYDFKLQFDTRRKWRERGYDYHTANSFMSLQRVFHRSRVTRFDVTTFDALLAQIDQP